MNTWIDKMRDELIVLQNEGTDFTDAQGNQWKIFLSITGISMDLDVRKI